MDIKEDEGIRDKLLDSSIENERRDDTSTSIKPGSGNKETVMNAQLDELVHVKPKTSSADEIRQNEDTSSNMKQHLDFQNSALQTIVGENKKSVAMQEKETFRNDTGNDGVQNSFHGCENVVVKATQSVPYSTQEVVSAVCKNGGIVKDPNVVTGFDSEVQPMSAQPELHVPAIRPRSLSPTVDFDGQNKRPTLICDFFAMGWCIKGSSCRFLHVKNHIDPIEQKSKGTVELQANEDVEDGFGRTGSSEFFNAAVPSERIASNEYGRNTRQNQFGENSLPFQRKDSSGLNGMTGFVPSETSISMAPNLHRMSHFNPLELNQPTREYRCTANNVVSFKMNISPFDWEPSVSFQPTFTITRNLLRGCLYDPVQDCVEQPAHSETSYKRELATSSSNQNRDLDPVPPGFETNITPKNHSLSNNLSDKNFDNREMFLNENEDTSGSHAVPQNRVPFIEDEKTSDISIMDKRGALSSDTRKPIIEMDANKRMNNQQESKIQKYFKATLIEFVKELVKPTWREGRLTKSAHKVIVKRTVEKILSSLEENQFPTTEDNVHQYLSTNQPTLSKLVARYIIKYG